MNKKVIVPGHKISWFVYAGLEKVRRTSGMRGMWGYDVECECGWKTATGGGTKRWLEDMVWDHKFDARMKQKREAA